MARRTKSDKKYKTRDYVVYFIVAFLLIFLTSSFVIEDIYNAADTLAITPDGVKAVYEASIGESVFKDNNTVDSSQSYNTDNTTQEQTN